MHIFVKYLPNNSTRTSLIVVSRTIYKLWLLYLLFKSICFWQQLVLFWELRNIGELFTREEIKLNVVSLSVCYWQQLLKGKVRMWLDNHMISTAIYVNNYVFSTLVSALNIPELWGRVKRLCVCLWELRHSLINSTKHSALAFCSKYF